MNLKYQYDHAEMIERGKNPLAMDNNTVEDRQQREFFDELAKEYLEP